jgi:hypothetical protein
MAGRKNRIAGIAGAIAFGVLMLVGIKPVQAQQGPPYAVKGSVLDAIALPGQMWITAGSASPIEKGNLLTQAFIEQDASVFATWNNSLWITPYVSAGLAFDAQGYSWNNKIDPAVGIKLNRSFRTGVISAGIAYTYENRFRNQEGATFRPTAGVKDFVQDWFAWDVASQQKGRFPGETWAIVGHLSPVEHGNLIEEAYITQGYVVKRFRKSVVIPYGEVTVGHDSQGFDWENKVIPGGGVKVGVSKGEAYSEIGLGYLRETRVTTGETANGMKVFISTSYSWNLFGRRVH